MTDGRGGHRGGGFTVAELLMALVTCSLIGAAALGVVTAVSRAQAGSDDYIRVIQASNASVTKLQHLIRRASLVTSGSPTEMVLWIGGPEDGAVIHSDEVVVLRYDAATGVVRTTRVRFPTTMAADVQLALNLPIALQDLVAASNAAEALAVIGNLAYQVTEDIAVGIEHLQFKYDRLPPWTQVVTMAIRFGEGGKTVAVNTSVALRADLTDWVTDNAGTLVLAAPVGP